MSDEKVNIRVSNGTGALGIIGFWFPALFSYAMYQDLFWAFVHGVFNWITVIYWIVSSNPLFFERVRNIIALVSGGQ